MRAFVSLSVLVSRPVRRQGVRYVIVPLDPEGPRLAAGFFVDTQSINCVAKMSIGDPDTSVEAVIRAEGGRQIGTPTRSPATTRWRRARPSTRSSRRASSFRAPARSRASRSRCSRTACRRTRCASGTACRTLLRASTPASRATRSRGPTRAASARRAVTTRSNRRCPRPRRSTSPTRPASTSATSS